MQSRASWCPTITILLILSIGGWAHAQPPDPAADDLLSKLKAFDAVLNAGSTVEGVSINMEIPICGKNSVPPARYGWKLSMTTGKIAFQRSIREVLDWKDVTEPGETLPSPGDDGHRLTVLEYILVDERAQFEYRFVVPRRFIPPIGVVSSPLTGQNGLASSGLLTMWKPEGMECKNKLRNILRLTGRFYSNYIGEIASMTERPDGMIEAKALGKVGGREEGVRWDLVIDPQSAYLVREAARFGADCTTTPEYTIRLTGQKWYGSLCIPERYELIEDWRGETTRTSGELSFASTEADAEFIVSVEQAMKMPYPVATNILDFREGEGDARYVPANEAARDEGISSSDSSAADAVIFNADLFSTREPNNTSGAAKGIGDASPRATQTPAVKDKKPYRLFTAIGIIVLVLLAGVIYGLVRRR